MWHEIYVVTTDNTKSISWTSPKYQYEFRVQGCYGIPFFHLFQIQPLFDNKAVRMMFHLCVIQYTLKTFVSKASLPPA